MSINFGTAPGPVSHCALKCAHEDGVHNHVFSSEGRRTPSLVPSEKSTAVPDLWLSAAMNSALPCRCTFISRTVTAAHPNSYSSLDTAAE